MTRLRKKLENLAIAIKTRNINDAHKYAKNTILILAGISISALTNTGIFQKAQDAEGKSKLADAKESMTLLLHEWQVEHVTSDKTLETFLGEKVADSTIEDYKKLENGNYEVYIKGYVGVIDSEGNLVEDVQKAGPRPTISNVK